MENNKYAQRLEPKQALITPSASPPSSRPLFPLPHRIPDKASPAKRPRLSSTPRPFQPHKSATPSSGPLDVINFHRARQESTMRLLDVWSGLAERYSRPLDEDDIVDITTGEVIKDRGVVRAFQKGTVGAFIDPEDAEDGADENENENEEDEDVDELDAFANPGRDREAEEVRIVPPTREADPRDAQDLKDFLEAERKRREIYGSEVDDTEDSAYESGTGEPYADESRQSAPVETSFDDATPEDDTNSPPPEPDRQVKLRLNEPVYVDSGSEDELGGWDHNEASMVYRLPKAEDSDSDEVEFVDPPTQAKSLSPEVPFPSPTVPSHKNIKHKYSLQHQLETPPQSQTSSIPSATPDDFYVQLPPDSSSPPRSSSPLSSHFDSSPIKPKTFKQTSNKPQSERKRLVPHAEHAALKLPIPRLDLTKLSGHRAAKHKLERHPRDSIHASEASTSPPPRDTRKALKASSSTLKVARAKTPKPKVEVVIERMPNKITPSGTSKILQQTKAPQCSGLSAKAKGKQKALSVDDRSEEAYGSDDEIPAASSPSARKGPRPNSRSLRTSTSSPAPVHSDSKEPVARHVPSLTKRPSYGQVTTESHKTGKKRKRVVSSAEAESDVEQPPPLQAPATQPLSRNASKSRTEDKAHDNESAIEREAKQKAKRKSASKPRSPSPDYDSGDTSYDEHDGRSHQLQHHSRAPSHLAEHPYYPYPPAPYPTPHHHDQQQRQHMYPPMPDPRAQLIIAQAMQQLSALVGGWPPPVPAGPHAPGSTPFTPSHQRHYRTGTPGSMYSTPTHHPHPYPYSYDPVMSSATLPPDSPEARSSSPSAENASSGRRRKSIVRRSQSRGRRVSFVVEGISDTMEVSSLEVRDKRGGRTGERSRKNIGAEASIDSDSEPKIETPSRGRSSTRGQTPGPSIQTQSRSHKQKSASQGASRSRHG